MLEGLRWDHAAAQRQGACFRAARFNDNRCAGRAMDRTDGTERNWRSRRMRDFRSRRTDCRCTLARSRTRFWCQGMGRPLAPRRCHNGLWPQTPQPRCDRGNCAIGLSETQGARNSIGEVLPVRWVGKRKRIRMAHPGAPKQVVECRSRTRRRGRFAEDHWQSLKALDPFATTFPANSRTGKYVRDARFVSSAPPIVLVGNRAGRRKSQ